MSNALKMTAAAGCLVLGVGGGVAMRALGDVTPPADQPIESKAAEDRMRVASVSGTARVLSRTGVWRPARKDDVIRRPSGFDVGRGMSALSISGSDFTMHAGSGAHGIINGTGQPLRVYLDDGHLVVQSPKDIITVVVAREGAEISGRSFGVRVDEGRVLVAGIGKEVEVRRRGQTNKFPQASEAVISSLGFRQVALPEQLTVTVESVEKRGTGWQMKGRTSPTARVLVRGERGAYAATTVEADGRFIAQIDGQAPAAGELIAFDTAGRTAEVGAPSGSIDAGPARAAAAAKPETEPAATPDALFPEKKPAATPVATPAATAQPVASAKPAKEPAKEPAEPKGKKPTEAAGDEDSITLDFDAEDTKKPSSKTVPMPKTETPPPVDGPAGVKPEKVPGKKPEEDDEVKLDW